MIKVLKEFERGVIFRLGQITGVAGPGLALSVPLIDRLVVLNLDEVIPEWRLAPPEEVNRMAAFLVAYYPRIPAPLSLGRVREEMRENEHRLKPV